MDVFRLPAERLGWIKLSAKKERLLTRGIRGSDPPHHVRAWFDAREELALREREALYGWLPIE